MLIAIGAMTAMLGVLLNLLLGLSRVALAMGRRGDLPARLAHVTVAVLIVGMAIAALAGPPYVGRALSQVLRELGSEGMRLVYSDEIVPARLTVAREPAARSGPELLDELLAPHGLAARRVGPDTYAIVRAIAPSPGPGTVGEATAASEPAEAESFAAGDARMDALIDYIDSRLAAPVVLADLARAARVSVRTLNELCRRHHGVTPMELLRNRRLDAVRARLRLQPEMSVTETALALGFGHPGRFSQYYFERFGELPSQTQAKRAS